MNGVYGKKSEDVGATVSLSLIYVVFKKLPGIGIRFSIAQSPVEMQKSLLPDVPPLFQGLFWELLIGQVITQLFITLQGLITSLG